MAGFFGIRDGVRLTSRQIKSQLTPFHSCFMLGLVLFVGGLGIAERMGLPRLWIGSIFLLAIGLLCAIIGFMSRTTGAAEYYVGSSCSGTFRRYGNRR